jgi:hypothetical protein
VLAVVVGMELAARTELRGPCVPRRPCEYRETGSGTGGPSSRSAGSFQRLVLMRRSASVTRPPTLRLAGHPALRKDGASRGWTPPRVGLVRCLALLPSPHSPTFSCRFSTGAPDPDVRDYRTLDEAAARQLGDLTRRGARPSAREAR